MTERDELAKEIFIVDNSRMTREQAAADWEEAQPEYAFHIADGLRAAGYRKPRVIETADELEALPVGAVVLDGDGVSWQKDRSPRTGKTWWGANNYDLPTSLLVERLGPFTVLWEGGE